MQLFINGEARQVDSGCTMAALIAQLVLGGKRLAVERNGDIVPRSRYAETTLQPGDRIEIVHAIGGG